FFFQAEDGIRDRNVTGVQTCALPISVPFLVPKPISFANRQAYGLFYWSFGIAAVHRCVVFGRALAFGVQKVSILVFFRVAVWSRSEERRVGKECGCRWCRARCKRDAQ